MAKPLENVKVLDFSRVLAGPYCSMMLADLGAEIIKLEPPNTGDDSRLFGPPFINGESIYFMSINRGKKSIVINLKTDKGKEIVRELVKKVDVLIENFRPGTMEKLGLGYEDLRKINPKLIYAACSGFGHTGPDSLKPGYDLILQAKGGIMSISSYRENGPFTRVGVSEADIVAGMITAFAIAGKLYQRQIDGKGDKIDVAMLDSQIAIMTPMIANYLNVGKIAKPVGNRHPLVSPFEVFKTKDSCVVVTAGNNKLFHLLCDILKTPRLKTDPRFKDNPDRVTNNAKLKIALERQTKKFGTDELLQQLYAAGIPASKINTVKETTEEPQALARNMFQKINHKKTGEIKLHGIPAKIKSCDDNIKIPPPLLGEHTKEILKKYLNYSEADVKKLVKENIVSIEKT